MYITVAFLFYKTHHTVTSFPRKAVETSGSNKAFMNNRLVVEIALVSVVVDSYHSGKGCK